MLIDRAAARFTRDRDLHGPQPETLPIRSPSRTRRQFFEEERILKVLNSPAPSSVCLLPAEISPVGSEVDLSGEGEGEFPRVNLSPSHPAAAAAAAGRVPFAETSLSPDSPELISCGTLPAFFSRDTETEYRNWERSGTCERFQFQGVLRDNRDRQTGPY